MNIRELVNVKKGRIYHYDVKGMLTGLHKGTKTVKVLKMEQRPNIAPLATVKSLQTGEVFKTDIGHLQPDVKLMKKKFKGALKYWKRTGIKPKYFKKIADDFSQRKLCWWDRNRKNWIINPYLIVLEDAPQSRNIINVLDSKGIVSGFGLAWIPEMEHKRSAEQTAFVEYEQKMYEEDYEENFGDLFGDDDFDDLIDDEEYYENRA